MFRLLLLGNGWTDCVEIWYAIGVPVVAVHAAVMGRVYLHVRTCRDTPTPRFCISETAWPIVFKFGMWVGGHELSAFHKSWVQCICTCARAHPFPYLANRWAHYSEISWVVRDPVAMRFVQVIGWAPLHVRTSFSVSQEPIDQLC